MHGAGVSRNKNMPKQRKMVERIVGGGCKIVGGREAGRKQAGRQCFLGEEGMPRPVGRCAGSVVFHLSCLRVGFLCHAKGWW